MKYAALGKHLTELANSDEVILRFEEIEEIIGARLPSSAYKHREWWANQRSGSGAPHWRSAGFEVDGVDLRQKLVRFRQATGTTTGRERETPGPKQSSRPGPTHQDVLLNASFRKIGVWTLKSGALVLTGNVPAQPATYALVVNGHIQYIGSSTGRGLKRRMYFYGKPGTGQRTSLRINALIKKRLLAGDSVELLAAFPEPTSWNGLPVDVVMGLELGLIRKLCPSWNMRGVSGYPLDQNTA